MASEDQPEQPPARVLSYDPTPAGCSRAEASELITRAVSEPLARKILPLLRPAIRIWPRADAPAIPALPCFGGLPALPPGYAWPTFEDKPLLFLGQINGVELHATVGANPLPERGLLQFYGDDDEVNGCGPYGDSAVLYFPDSDALRPAPAPIEDFSELPRCGVDFYTTGELPDPRSEIVANLGLSAAEQEAYGDLRGKLTTLGGAAADMHDRQSKLLGWPDLIQRDLGDDCGKPDAGAALLLRPDRL